MKTFVKSLAQYLVKFLNFGCCARPHDDLQHQRQGDNPANGPDNGASWLSPVAQERDRVNKSAKSEYPHVPCKR